MPICQIPGQMPSVLFSRLAPGASIGKIDILDVRSFVAIDRRLAKQAVAFFAEGKVKGRRLRARRLR